jgi:flagellar assembly factor FliW
MSSIKIKKNCKGYNIDCHGNPTGSPVPTGTRVRFTHGIPGFEQIREWEFTTCVDIFPFFHMTAADGSVSFVCIDTFRICPDYHLYLPFPVSEPLTISDASAIAVLSIVTVGRSPEDTTANLMSPIVVNLDSKQGEQAISDSSPYPLKYRIWDSLNLGGSQTPEDELQEAMG